MSDPFSPFPTATPKPAAGSMPTPGFQFQYMRAYNYVFENPNWLTTVLLWALCILAAGIIPVLPYLVLLGHFFEIIISLLATQGTRYPDFDFNRFGEYLGRSVWAFLVAMIFVVPMMIALYAGIIVVVLLAAGAASAGGDGLGPVLAIVVGLLGFVLVLALMIAASLFITPMVLRAGLQGDFGAAFNFGWALDFIKKTWLEMILANLFIQLTGMLLTFIGLLVLCVGIYPANALVFMAQAYMFYQLYLLYLSRGGTPIPIKPPAPNLTAPSAVVGPPPGYQPPR